MVPSSRVVASGDKVQGGCQQRADPAKSWFIYTFQHVLNVCAEWKEWGRAVWWKARFANKWIVGLHVWDLCTNFQWENVPWELTERKEPVPKRSLPPTQQSEANGTGHMLYLISKRWAGLLDGLPISGVATLKTEKLCSFGTSYLLPLLTSVVQLGDREKVLVSTAQNLHNFESCFLHAYNTVVVNY